MKFVLEINLGNEAATKYSDVCYMLRKTESRINDWAKVTSACTGTIMDYNGNTVGEWNFYEQDDQVQPRHSKPGKAIQAKTSTQA
jgi:hypothetical protein